MKIFDNIEVVGAGTSFLIKNNSGVFELRNGADSAYKDLKVNNLYVEGTETIINTETLSVADNIVLLNNDVTGTPSENAGIEVERGTSTNASIIWDESNDIWKAGLAGAEVEVILSGANPQFGFLGVGASASSTDKLTITTTSTTNNNKAINISSTGSTTGTNYGVYSSVSGASVGNWAFYAAAGNSYFNNIGLGTTDIELWNTNYRVIEGYASALMLGVSGTFAGLMSNVYFKTDYKYYRKTADAVSFYNMSHGIHYFYTAPSGDADTEVSSWTLPLTINNDGSIYTGATGKFGRDADNLIDFTTDNQIMFRTNATDNRLTIGDTGNVTINTNKTSATILSIQNVNTNASALAMISFNTSARGAWLQMCSENHPNFPNKFSLELDSSSAFIINYGVTPLFEIGSGGNSYFAGNIGLGTIDIETTSLGILQFPTDAISYTKTAGETLLALCGNCYYNSGWKYRITNEASVYQMYDGSHYFNVALSGTADTTISFTTALYINNSGNIGIGTTDIEAWHTNYRVIEFAKSAIMTSIDASYFIENAYFDGAWKYKTTAAASMYYQSAGTHTFSVATSGTINEAATLASALSIDNSKNILINAATAETSEVGGLTMKTGTLSSSSTADQITIQSGDVNGAGTAGLCIRSEVGAIAETDETKFSKKIPILYNGALIYLMGCES